MENEGVLDDDEKRALFIALEVKRLGYDDPRVANWVLRVMRLLPALESALKKN